MRPDRLREPSTGWLFSSAFSGHQNIPVLAYVNHRWRRNNYPLSVVIIVLFHKGGKTKTGRRVHRNLEGVGTTRAAAATSSRLAMKFSSPVIAI